MKSWRERIPTRSTRASSTQRGGRSSAWPGGHENTIPECARFDGEQSAGEEDTDTDPRDMEVAVAAMRAIGSLHVADRFKPEQKALMSGLGFAAFGRGFGGLDVVAEPGGAAEEGAVVFEYPDHGGPRAITPP